MTGSTNLSVRRLLGGFRFDEPRKQCLQRGEVGIELAAGLVAEATGRLAHGEPEHRGADQTLDLGDPVTWDPGVAKCPVDGFSSLAGFRGYRRPPEQQGEDARVPAGRGPDVPGEHTEALGPRWPRRRRRELGEQHLDYTVEQVGLVGHVPVERHGRDPKALGESRHGERVEPRFVGQGKRLGEDLCAVDARWPPHATLV